ncbi:hypothetical protein IWW50_005979 [Coemansia erecta]|nr:hypothetical protein GGF43_003301 [Coemansia sp. RSA 2618]KAJ2817976.1 hypothetical protein IWW50_005979 [Coemansia erecta]
MPLLQCLRSFDPHHSHIQPRPMSGYKAWSQDDIRALMAFTETHFRCKMDADDWVLAGKYMNIYHLDCINKMWLLNEFRMTPQLYTQVTEFLRDGLLWPTICSKLPGSQCSPDILRFVYSTTPEKKVEKPKRPKPAYRINKHERWTEEEDRHLLALLSRYGPDEDIDWNSIVKATGHAKNPCRYRRIRLQKQQEAQRSQTNRKSNQSLSPDMSISDDMSVSDDSTLA